MCWFFSHYNIAAFYVAGLLFNFYYLTGLTGFTRSFFSFQPVPLKAGVTLRKINPPPAEVKKVLCSNTFPQDGKMAKTS
jgi:hypothetical protein